MTVKRGDYPLGRSRPVDIRGQEITFKVDCDGDVEIAFDAAGIFDLDFRGSLAG